MKFDTITITNSIYTNLTITNDQTASISDVPTTWGSTSLFNCNFTTLFAGNPDSFSITNVKSILLKRKKDTDISWITLCTIPVFTYTDLIFEYHDYYNQSGVNYIYALVEIDLANNEGVYNEQTIYSQFNKAFLVDKNTSYDLTNATTYNNMARNQQTGTYVTFGRQYPIVVANGNINYTSMNTSAYLILDMTTNNFNRYEQTQYENEYLDFLLNKSGKILKDYNGSIWLISVVDSADVSPIQELGNGICSTSFNWVEVGDNNSMEDLTNAGLLPNIPYSRN